MGTKDTFSDDFFTFIEDFNGDGWPDILQIGFPGSPAVWFENPGSSGVQGNQAWKKHGLRYGDVNHDGRADILEADGWWEQPKSLANDPLWKFHPVSFGSGLGQTVRPRVLGSETYPYVTYSSSSGVSVPYGGSQMLGAESAKQSVACSAKSIKESQGCYRLTVAHPRPAPFGNLSSPPPL